MNVNACFIPRNPFKPISKENGTRNIKVTANNNDMTKIVMQTDICKKRRRNILL